jgi:crotonobetainyl-CoA:carnitine CoA-transferase CaiB-like acyl-CoA transferase
MGVLSVYRVLDLADEKGMLCTGLLADMGAEVIHINPEIPAECKKIRSLAKKADILVETLPPGYLKSLGVGYTELRKKNPGLVMASVTQFGQSGPYRDFKSCDLVAQALGGWLSVTGTPRAPLRLFGGQAYAVTSLFTANAILLALWQRHVTGRGKYIDVSVMECVAATLDHVFPRYFYQSTVARRRGNRHWNDAFQVFPCKDGYILLSIFQHWDTLVAWLESEGMAAGLVDKKWQDRNERIKGLTQIVAVLKKWTLTRTAGELMEKGQLMHFPWAKIESLPEVLRNPRLQARDYSQRVKWPV